MSENLQIYFGGALSGLGESIDAPIILVPLYARIEQAIVSSGYCDSLLPQMTKGKTLHEIRDWMLANVFSGVTFISMEQFYRAIAEFNYDRLYQANAGILELTYPSNGAGMEFENLRERGRPVLILWDVRVKKHPTAMAYVLDSPRYWGNPYSRLKAYGSEDEAIDYAQDFLNTLKQIFRK